MWKDEKNLQLILCVWRKQILVLNCFFLLSQKLIFINSDWSDMLAIVWNCTVANQFQQDKTIRMTVNEWHPHSVLNLRGKKYSKLTPQLAFGHVLFKTSFFANHRSAYFWVRDCKCDNTIPFTVFGDFGGFQKWKQRKAGSPLSDVWLNIQNPGC